MRFVVQYVLVLRDYGLYLFTFVNRVPLMRYGAGGVSGVASFISIDEQLQ